MHPQGVLLDGLFEGGQELPPVGIVAKGLAAFVAPQSHDRRRREIRLGGGGPRAVKMTAVARVSRIRS